MKTVRTTMSALASAYVGLGERLPDAAHHATADAAEDLAGPLFAQAVAETKPYAPVDTGAYETGCEVELTSRGATVRNDAPYATDIEIGRAPGGDVASLAAELRPWAERKGIDPSAVTAIARSIVNNGTAPRWVMRRAVDKLRGRFTRLLRTELGRA